MEKDLEKIRAHAKEAIRNAADLGFLEQIRVEYMGRKSALTAILRGLKDLPINARKRIGQEANHLAEEIERLLSERKRELGSVIRESILAKERLDVTMPGSRIERGHQHPVTKVLAEIEGIFGSMGFETVDGPEVETDFYNFEALNMPPGHPARDMWDTFWLKNKLLLRTHTSPVQVRYMEKHNPPIRIIVPGRVYRYEATDASHEIQFEQLEGLVVDTHISVANFKAVMQEFFSRFYGNHIEIQLRPSYFPFVEPGFEIFISCVICKGKGCSVCKQTGWLEIGGAGMVHPNVFKAVGYNPKQARGFAFGLGFSRMIMMKYKIPDVRLFNSGDLRFLKQF
ncbi:MAG: phenylalanine--tRNA ligase subunit alpha [Candidatus Sungbacteria bacterium]|nr:phenylalanine--tRNA ligase subunit alpha [Candidatus Sungbacteria bacterium]